MISEDDFKKIFYNTLNKSYYHKISFDDIKPLHNDLKNFDELKLTQIIKLISFIKAEMNMKYNQDVINTPNYFDTKLKSDISLLIKANRANVKFLGYSPLIANIFKYYLYLNKFKNVKKFKKLEEKLLQEWNDMSSYSFGKNMNNKTVHFYFRLYFWRAKAEPYKRLEEINIKEEKIEKLKKSIESIYTRKIHNNTFYKVFIKILVENNITNEILANKILKQIFGYNIYIESVTFNEKEVMYVFNRINIRTLKRVLQL